MGVAGVKDVFHGVTDHDFWSGPEGDLFLVEDEGVGEDVCHAFELMMRGDDEVAGFAEVDEAIGEMAAALDVEPVKRFIEEKDVGFLGECAGDVGALLLPAAELVNLAVGDLAQFHASDRLLGLFFVNFPKAAEVAEVWVAAHCDDVADAEWEVALVLIDLREVGNLSAGFRDGVLSPIDAAFFVF